MSSRSRCKPVNKQDLCSQGACSSGQESYRATNGNNLFAGGNNRLLWEAQGRLNQLWSRWEGKLHGRPALDSISRKEEKEILSEGAAYI